MKLLAINIVGIIVYSTIMSVICTSIDEKYPFTTDKDSIREKDWAAGSNKECINVGYYYTTTKKDGVNSASNKFTFGEEKFAPAWLKCIDEVIVNAVDHAIRTRKGSHQHILNNISIDVKGDNISVYNDGTGVDVILHPTATAYYKQDTYVPTLIFGILFQGENRVKDKKSIIGGTNGMGAKIANCFSREFIVETVDHIRGFKFVQKWTRGMEEAHPPVITKCASTPYTRITFTLNSDILHKINETVVHTRAVFASIYAQLVDPKIKVSYNGRLIPCKSMLGLARDISPGPSSAPISMEIRGEFNWDIVCNITKQKEARSMSVVNGIVVMTGAHIRYVKNLIINGIIEKTSKLFTEGDIKLTHGFIDDNITLFICAQIYGVNWTGQCKDVLGIAPKTLAKQLPALDPVFIKKIVDGMMPILKALASVNAHDQSAKKPVVDYDKYIPAKKFKPVKPIMIVAEGDSAMNQVKIGILKNSSFDHYGLFSLCGVPMNARKFCAVEENTTDKYVKMTKKFKDNKVYSALFGTIGLNIQYKYDPKSPAYAKECAELVYNGILMCVDQDLDGKGNIMGLFINLFIYLWPNLVDDGFIKWYSTPIIRAFPSHGGRVESFYAEPDYDLWAERIGENALSKYKIQYYKGLGTHSIESIEQCFKDMESHITIFYNDDHSRKLFASYYGSNAEYRKDELRKPAEYPSKELLMAQIATRRMSTTDLARFETLMYFKDNLERKLDSFIDGQNQAGRKILYGILKKFKANNTLIRVAQLAGFISEKCNYHHGEASLCDSITKKAFIATGGKQLPFLLPDSNFGSRLGGGKEASSPRYIFTKLNNRLTSLLFPAEDFYLLPFTMAEGARYEPNYYIPILPLAICESTHVPAHGWKLKCWARSVDSMIIFIKYKINHDTTRIFELPLYKYDHQYKWTGTLEYDIKNGKPKAFSVGKYELVKKYAGYAHITELPLRVWVNDYVTNLRKKAFVKSIDDNSTDVKIDIKITFMPGVFDELLTYDRYDIIQLLELRESIGHNLNMMGPDLSVVEFTSYGAILNAWFDIRKEYYGKRVRRVIKLKELQLVMLRNQLKYITSTNIDVQGLEESAQDDLLKSLGFAGIDTGLLRQPKYTHTDDLERLITAGGYDYLLNINDRGKSAKSIETLRNKINELQDEYDIYVETAYKGRFPGAEIWSHELDEIASVIKEGIRTSWQFENYGKFKY